MDHTTTDGPATQADPARASETPPAETTTPGSGTAPTAVYRVTDVRREYPRRSGAGTVHALRDVDLEIGAGEYVAVQGPTGGGKSTLLQLLGGLDAPTSGSVLLGDVDLSSARGARRTSARAESIGFVFQSPNLIPTLSARENVETGLVPLRVVRAERERRAREVLEQVGLGERADHLPGELSGGQQQRVAIARAIVKRPAVVLADEPTGALDESTRDEIIGVLERLREELGLTLVIVTHDRWVARRADRRVRIANGEITDDSGRAA